MWRNRRSEKTQVRGAKEPVWEAQGSQDTMALGCLRSPFSLVPLKSLSPHCYVTPVSRCSGFSSEKVLDPTTK